MRGMTWFQTTYTVRYNARHRTSGHLYGGRYKAVLVETPDGGSAGDADYFSTLVDYIHLNYPALLAGSADSLRLHLTAAAA